MHRLAATDRTALLTLGRPASWRAKAVVIRQGEEGRDAYLLLSGFVRIVDTEDVPETLLGARGRGDLIGEMSVVSSGPRSASAIAVGPVRARAIGASEFLAYLREHSTAGIAVAGMVADRLRWANRRRVDAHHPPPVRIGRVLLDLIHQDAPPQAVVFNRSRRPEECHLGLTQSSLASLAGVSASAAEKVLREFRAQEIVRTAYRQITVADMEALRRVAYPTV